MSGRRRSDTAYYQAETAHRVIECGRAIVEVARELGVIKLSSAGELRTSVRRSKPPQRAVWEPFSAIESIPARHAHAPSHGARWS